MSEAASTTSITVTTVVIEPGTQTVKLTYSNGTGNANENAAGSIVYTMQAAGWFFVGIQDDGSNSAAMNANFSCTVSGDRLTLTLQDTDATQGQFGFKFVVSNGTSSTYTSVDPEVINKPT